MNTDELTGFGSYLESEAIQGALPRGQNSPQHVPYELYAEQLNGSAFTAPRHRNLRSWLYRIQPSVVQQDFVSYTQNNWLSPPFSELTPPNPLRWSPPPTTLKNNLDFVDSLTTICGTGNARASDGAASLWYVCNHSMENRFFYDADGDLLIVPYLGGLQIKTEFGNLNIKPKEIALIPRGIKFQVQLEDNLAAGYVLENYGAPFLLPDLGPIGANGLANPRDFIAPSADYSTDRGNFKVISKFLGHFWQAEIDHHPLNVVAWHGNYLPYKYNLKRFNTINTVSFDHPDPSIFTVLTSPSTVAGVANIDFVIFPERWMVAENTFRPPYFHRNLMSEFMGLIEGTYDAKSLGFNPGGFSIHNAFSGHGPDAEVTALANQSTLSPTKYEKTLAFMFETRGIWQVTSHAMQANFRQKEYSQCWQKIPAIFKD